MKIVKLLVLYPILYLLISVSADKAFFEDVAAWCKWKGLKKNIWSICFLFAAYKEFRNVLYYRLKGAFQILNWLFPRFDHLQIVTPRNKIGGGLIIQHGFSTIISAKSVGRNCKIYQQVTIGYNHKLEAPEIGDNVEICCGAKVIGGVHIGNNVLIGANSVVIKDVPDNCVVAGVPARIIKELSDKCI